MGCLDHKEITIKKRVGTDLFLTFALFEKEQAVDLSARRNIEVRIMKHGSVRRYKTENFTTEGNQLSIQYNATANDQIGVYDVSISYDVDDDKSETGFQHIVHDIPLAFEIVPVSVCETGLNIPVESHVVRFGTDGLDAFECWKKHTNRPTATFDDYLEALREPLRNIKTSYEGGYLTLEL